MTTHAQAPTPKTAFAPIHNPQQQQSTSPPPIGALVKVRARLYVVDNTHKPIIDDKSHMQFTQVDLSCLDDDAAGELLSVFWEQELDAEICQMSWEHLKSREFDDPSLFAAYVHALRWNCSSAAHLERIQAPWRAGIAPLAYQLSPLRKALNMPRVNLFIADDVGLGKTIEAGLVLREMMLRQKVRRVVIAAPPSVVVQWAEEMEQRFGLTFAVYNRDFVANCRAKRGYHVNPWNTHSRFIISHALLHDEEYARPLLQWLGDFAPQSMLILDEAHHAAPASRAKYAVDSLFTKAIRKIAASFEHKLFLSATPHNGLSNSFSALLEILDPQRFCRGIPVNAKLRDEVMIRRLKKDLRPYLSHDDKVPERRVEAVYIKELDEKHPDLLLAQYLRKYRDAVEQNYAAHNQNNKDGTSKTSSDVKLVLVNLQKRLLSSVAAFYRTLFAHAKPICKRIGVDIYTLINAVSPAVSPALEDHDAENDGIDHNEQTAHLYTYKSDDQDEEMDEEEIEDANVRVVEKVSKRKSLPKPSAREVELLQKMLRLAHTARHQPDARVLTLVQWIRQHLLNQPENTTSTTNTTNTTQKAPLWNQRRLIVFTEYVDTKNYLQQQLIAHLGLHEDNADADRYTRIQSIYGGMTDEARETVKRAFNSDPASEPLRILLATDAAREGINLQNHCSDLFHFDLPWNPSRLEQRNGRIDRKLQRADVVFCRYFVYTQRPEDRVLEVLVERTKTIQDELGCLPTSIEEKMIQALQDGIPLNVAAQQQMIDALKEKNSNTVQIIQTDLLFTAQSTDVVEETEDAAPIQKPKDRSEAIAMELDSLRHLFEESRQAMQFNGESLRHALSESLRLLRANAVTPVPKQTSGIQRYQLPDIRSNAWDDTLDTLRKPRDAKSSKMTVAEWRSVEKIRPVVFEAPHFIDDTVVHLHLEHRVVQRLLSRFLSQGFVLDDIARACIGQTKHNMPRVVLLGRISIFGKNAARLHDEIIAVAAEIVQTHGKTATERLRVLEHDDAEHTWQNLVSSLQESRDDRVPAGVIEQLHRVSVEDIEYLKQFFEAKAKEREVMARDALKKRAATDVKEIKKILDGQRKRIQSQMSDGAGTDKNADKNTDKKRAQLSLGFTDEELAQLESDRKHWVRVLGELESQMETEPKRIRDSYDVKIVRCEPAGIAYLWPVTG